MPLTGDSLTILLFFAGGTIACAVGALTAPKGWRARTLWVGTALFAAACALLLGRFPRLTTGSALTAIAVLTPPVTVSIVALMLPRRRAADDSLTSVVGAVPSKKRRSAEAKNMSQWVPDMSLREAAIYVSTASTWRPPYGRTIDTKAVLKEEIRKRLYAGQVTAWGRAHPETEEYQISDDAWSFETEMRIETSYAFFPIYGVPMHGIRLAKGEVEAAWPARAKS